MEDYFKFTTHEKNVAKYKTLLASMGLRVIGVTAHAGFGDWRTIELDASVTDCEELLTIIDQMGTGDTAA